MSNKKLFTPKEAALAVLGRVEEILKKSEVMQKYSTENSSKLGYKPSELGAKEVPQERDYKAFEVEKGKAGKVREKDSRLAHQISPSKNPKEEAEGNNEPDGSEPKNLGKAEKLQKKYEGFKAVEESARKSGASDPAAVAAAAGRKKYGKEAFQAAAAKGKKMGKAENPDEKEDADLGEKVEDDVLHHMKDNKEAEKEEGHRCPFCSCMHKSEDFVELCGDLHSLSKAESKHDRCVEDVERNSPDVKSPHAVCVSEGVRPDKWKKEEGQEQGGEGETAFIPAKLIGSAKLSKFCERIHAKRKARENPNE